MEGIRPESSITLVIKTPNQRVADIEVNCLLNWTVAKLKTHLTNVYPTKPSRSSQKIIYSGKLLDDHFILKDVLLENDGRQQTVHLVCTPSSSELSSPQTSSHTNEATVTSEVTSTTNITTTTPSHDGLRQRQAPPAYLQPPYYNMYQQNIHGYQPQNYYTPGQHHTPPNVHHLMIAQHMAHMQWLNHMSQMMQAMPYTQHYAYHHVGTGQPHPNIVPPAEPVQPAPAPQAAADGVDREVNQERNMVMNANAGGGMMQEDDDDQDNVQRDWLDHIYMGVRIIMLLSIFWFYSSVERLVLMVVAMFIVWIIQSGWFQINRGLRNRPADMANEEQQEVVEGVEESDSQSDDDDGDDDDSDDSVITDNDQPGFFVICYNFVTTFFLSLVPQGPRAVN